MGIITAISKIKLPKFKDVTEIPTKARTDMQRTTLNTIDVLFFDRQFINCIQTVATIQRETAIPRITIELPALLSFFLLDNSEYNNLTTGKKFVICREGYPFAIVCNNELLTEIHNAYYEDKVNGLIGEHGKQLYEKTKIPYEVPVTLNKLPIKAIRIKLDEDLKELIGAEDIELTPDLLYQLGHHKFIEGVSEKSIDGAVIIFILGCLVGSILMTIVLLFLWG